MRAASNSSACLPPHRQAAWAATYLAIAGALIGVAAGGAWGPDPDARAAQVEARASDGLARLGATAAGVAESWERTRRERQAERAGILALALAATKAWAEDVAWGTPGLPDGLPAGLAIASPKLAPILPEGVAASVVGPDGATLFSTGRDVDWTIPGTLATPAGDGLTVAVAFERPAELMGTTAPRELVEALAPLAAEEGIGLRFVGPDGEVAAEIAPRPAAAGGNAEDAENERLISSRHPVPSLGWTVVAERLHAPEILADGGAGRTAGLAALAALGVLAAAAFAHVVWVGRAGSLVRRKAAHASQPDATDTACADDTSQGRPSSRKLTAFFPSAVARPTFPDEEVCGQAEQAPPGASILRLRKSLGVDAAGPRVAAYARSPILRALSRQVNAGAGPESPALAPVDAQAEPFGMQIRKGA